MDIYSNGELMYMINMNHKLKYSSNNNKVSLTVNANLKTRMNIIIGIKIYVDDILQKTIGEYCIARSADNIYNTTIKIDRGNTAKRIPIRIETFCVSTANKTVNGTTYIPITGHTTSLSDTINIASKSTILGAGAFNEDLDKITEAEVVYDFVERLSIGKDFTLEGFLPNWKIVGVLFSAGTKFLNLIKRLYISLPSVLVTRDDIKAVNINIQAGSTNASVSCLCQAKTIVTAYSDKARLDVSSIIKVETISGNANANLKVTATFDSPYPYNDTITVYLK